MLVSDSDQVTRRKFSQRETRPPSPVMFTRSQAAANPTSTARTVTSSPLPFTTASVVSGGGGTVTTHSTTNSTSDAASSVSLTITAVNIPDSRDGCITTISTPVLDTPTITNLVSNSLEGVHSGVPTRTTPTSTPTTSRNIEQTFSESSSVQPPETHTNQAGFVPPLVQPTSGNTYVSVDSKCWGGGTLTQIPHTTAASTGVHSRAPPAAHAANSPPAPLTMPSQISQQHQTQRRTGGRRPIKDERITAEEEERRSSRRERNKSAAARCRKRRLDQTNMSQDETDESEDKKSESQTEIQLSQQQRDELEFSSATHKAVCRRRVQSAAPAPAVTTAVPTSVAPVSAAATMANTQVRVVKKHQPSVSVKEEPMEEESVQVQPAAPPTTRPRRPTSLNVAPVALRTPSVADLGVSIETPSAGSRGLNFDSMMEGGTGSTPVTSGTGLTPSHTGLTPLSTPVVSAPSGSVSNSNNCGTQQRSSSSDLSSPESVPPKSVSL